MGSAAGYCNIYGCATAAAKPNYEIPPPSGCAATDDAAVANMRGNWDMNASNACNDGGLGGFGYLTSVASGGEDLVLFKWASADATVKDIDYVVWGTAAHISKTGVSGYVNDTAVGSQKTLPGAPSNSQSFQRICMNEGTQTRTGGNGITGGDETSENLDQTFVVRDPTPKAATAGATP